jgi:hypothetical protein
MTQWRSAARLAATTLVGWYIMAPAVIRASATTFGVDSKAPLSQWTMDG